MPEGHRRARAMIGGGETLCAKRIFIQDAVSRKRPALAGAVPEDGTAAGSA